jgi:hypothetical protein
MGWASSGPSDAAGKRPWSHVIRQERRGGKPRDLERSFELSVELEVIALGKLDARVELRESTSGKEEVVDTGKDLRVENLPDRSLHAEKRAGGAPCSRAGGLGLPDCHSRREIVDAAAPDTPDEQDVIRRDPYDDVGVRCRTCQLAEIERWYSVDISGLERTKSAVARLQAIGTLHTTAIRRSALTSTS